MVRNHSYNRNNPFLYTYDATNQRLVNELGQAIKNFMYNGISEGSLLLLLLINSLLAKRVYLFPIVISLMIFIFSFIELTLAVKANKTNEINAIKYDNGMELSYRYVNNEELFSQVNELNISLGKVKLLSDMMKLFNLAYIVMMGGYLINLLILIFNK